SWGHVRLAQLEYRGQPCEVGRDRQRGLGVRDRRVGILEAVPGERQDEDVARAEPSARAELQRTRERDRGRGFGEDALRAREETIRGEDVVVADRVDRAARLVARGLRTLPAGGVADADRGRDRPRL